MRMAMMFNLFKKHKRSDWMKGLQGAERDVECSGIEHCSWALNDAISCGLMSPFSNYSVGYRDYLDYYENNLKNI